MDFKSLREDKLKLSQEQFADIYDVSIEQVQLWDAGDLTGFELSLIQKIASKSNLDFNDIMNYEKPRVEALKADYTWGKADLTKKSLKEYLHEALDKTQITQDYKKKYIDDFKIGMDTNLLKPSIAIVGRSDTGKSTLINSLIGMDKMPTSWTPTTSIAVYIKHINERPSFIKEDAWIFANECDGENIWNSKRLSDEEYCKKWKIAAGEIDILRKFGTRQGGGLETNAGSAVVFIDAPVLLNCDIVDLPGFGTETERDDEITLEVAQKTDILIYLSQANGFMRIEDIEYLKQNVRNLPVWEQKGVNNIRPLSNLFVVASQAHVISGGNEIELKNILNKGYENFSKTLAGDYWNARKNISGYEYSKKVVSNRFFTYTTDIPALCERFLSELKAIIEQLPQQIYQRAIAFAHQYVDARKPELKAEIVKFEKIADDRDKYSKLLDDIKKTKVQRADDNDRSKKEIKDKIQLLRAESLDEYSKYCSETLNTDALVRKIKNKKIKNKKEEIECFASQLQDEMQDKCSQLLDEKSEELSISIKNYVTHYSEGIQTCFQKSDVDVDFDVRFAFASAISKIGIIGGLGAYLAGEAVFLLGSFNFCVGVGGQIAFGAIALGPIGMFIGLAIAASLGIAKLFGGGWEKSIAKKIVKAYEKNDVVAKYHNAIVNYWDDTDSAFNKATKKLDEEWDAYVKTLQNTVNEYSVETIQENIVALKNIESFFDNIPLS